MKNTFKYLFVAVLLATATFSCKKNEAIGDPTSVTDIDGNVYPVLRICGKLWTTENLKTTRYNDGTVIPTGLSNTDWNTTTTGAFALYDADAANNAIYGKLYNWFAASNTKLAPVGWHIATEAEWIELVNCLDGSSVAGGKMKATTLWDAPNLGATNSSGFNGLPAGYRGVSGDYALKGKSAYFWGADQRSATQGEYLVLDNNLAGASRNAATKQFGYSVRCVKD